ncbi:MAG: hypothetical protein CMJ64_10360 [Planctomycetaceae bacterium]|nr:hypothetical protein [Planctomycetaceae bacterium]
MTRLTTAKTELTSDDGDVLRKISEQFKKVAETPDYRAVAQLDGFVATRQSVEKLSDQVMQLQPSTPAASMRRVLTSLSANLLAIDKADKEKSEAQKAWEQAVADSAKADKIRTLLKAIGQRREAE